MDTFDQVLDLLRRCSFRIRIKESSEDGETVWFFGTGFFITCQGHALTAFHNLPEEIRTNNAGEVDVYYRNLSRPVPLCFHPELSHPDDDIAVLQLPDPGTIAFDPLDLAYYPLEVNDTERKRAWSRTGRLYVFGFPVRGLWRGDQVHTAQADFLIEGRVGTPALSEVVEYDSQANRNYNVTRLQILADRTASLGGISGGPVLDAASGRVVAVEGSYDADNGVVYASDLTRIVARWRHSGQFALLEAVGELKPRPRTTPTILGRAREHLDPALHGQICNELADLFPAAEFVVVCDCLERYSQDQQAELVLGVEVHQGDSYQTHIVILGSRSLIARHYEGFQRCLQGRPFASRILFNVGRHELAENRLAVIYQNAYQFYGGDRHGNTVQSLEGAARQSVATGVPAPGSLERVIRQIYADLGRWLYQTAREDPSKARSFYQQQLEAAWDQWFSEAWRLKLRRNLIWLFCGRDSPDSTHPAAYLDPYDYLRWAMADPSRLPDTLVGCSHGALDGRNIVVGIQRGEVEYPSVFDYWAMGPENVLVWDFVQLETELKVRLLSELYQDATARQAMRPGDDCPESWKEYLDPQRPPVRVEDYLLPAGELAFAFGFERKLAQLTQHINPGSDIRVSWLVGDDQSTGSAKLDRALAILLRIRVEAALCLGNHPVRLRGPRSWKDEYYFALAAYSLSTAKLSSYDDRQSAIALLGAGVALAQAELARNTIRSMMSPAGWMTASEEFPGGSYPSYQIPMAQGYRLWQGGSPEARRQALAIMEPAYANFQHAIPFVREYALVLAADGEHDKARRLIEPVVPLCRVFGDHETLCRVARTWRDEGNKAWDRNPVPVNEIGQHSAYDWFKTAFELYQEAFEFSDHYYPGICSGQMAATLGHRDEAEKLALRVREACDRYTLGRLPENERFWVLDSKGTALLLLERTSDAVQLYHRALEQLPPDKAGLVQISYNGICRLHWALGDEVVGPLAKVFWDSEFRLDAGPMGDCGRRGREQ